MKVIVLGGGSVGSQIAQQLIDERVDVVVIEKDAQVVRSLANKLDCTVLHQEGNSLDALRKAGAADADVFVAVTDSDEVNMVTCGLVSGEFNVACKIARIRNLNYSDAASSTHNFLGIDAVVNPEAEASRELIQSIEHGAMGDVILFAHSRLQIRSLPVSHTSVAVGKTVQQVFQELEADVLAAAIFRKDDYIIPDGSVSIQEGDILYLVGLAENLENVFRYFGKIPARLNKVVIVGGGRAGARIAEHILCHRESVIPGSKWLRRLREVVIGKNVVIIEKDRQKCKELAGRFPKALVIQADISEDGVFAEHNLSNSDLVMAVTDNQELNIVTALYARSLGIPKAAVLVNNTNYAAICSRLEIDSVTSIKQSVISSVLRNIKRSKAQSVHSLFDGRLEILELQVDEGCPVAGKSLRDIRFERDTLVLSASRGEEHRIPDGRYILLPGDTVVVIAKREFAEATQAMFVKGL